MSSRIAWWPAWGLFLAAVGCVSDGPSAPAAADDPAARPVAITYQVHGATAAPLVAGLAGRPDGPAVLPAGYREDDPAAVEPTVPGRDDVSMDDLGTLHGRLEVRETRSGVVARVSLYDREPVAPAPPRKRSGLAARHRGAPQEEPVRPAGPEPWSIYELELPAGELALLLDELAATGAFDSQERPDGGTKLELGATDRPASKAWTPEPRLDDLAERVLREGRPVVAERAMMAERPAGRVRLSAE